MGWHKEYPRDKNGRVLRIGDYVIVDYIYIWEDGRQFENQIAIVDSFSQDSWGLFRLKVKFSGWNGFNDSNRWTTMPDRCEWITKRKKIREQKLFLMKLEDV